MGHSKSEVSRMVEKYKHIYNEVKNYNKILFCKDISNTWDIIAGLDSEKRKDEIHHYKEVIKAYNSLMFALENALGMDSFKR